MLRGGSRVGVWLRGRIGGDLICMEFCCVVRLVGFGSGGVSFCFLGGGHLCPWGQDE